MVQDIMQSVAHLSIHKENLCGINRQKNTKLLQNDFIENHIASNKGQTKNYVKTES